MYLHGKMHTMDIGTGEKYLWKKRRPAHIVMYISVGKTTSKNEEYLLA